MIEIPQIDPSPAHIVGAAPNDLTAPLSPDQQTTFAVILAVAIVLIVWDGWTGYRHGSASTESWTVAKLSANWPVIPLAFGILIGHLFTGMHGIPDLEQRVKA